MTALFQCLFWAFVIARAALPWVLLIVLVLIWIGWRRGWKWVRNPWLRAVHLAFAALLVVDMAKAEWEGMSLTEIVALHLLYSPYMSQSVDIGLAHNLVFLGLTPGTLGLLYFLLLLPMGVTWFTCPQWWSRQKTEPGTPS